MKGRPVHLLGVGLDLGAGRRGVDMGPSAIRIAGIHDALRGHGVSFTDHGDCNPPVRETLETGDEDARYLEPIAEVCRRAAERVRDSVNEGALPVVLGGDHSCAMGSISGVAAALRDKGGRPAVIWVDAHGDMNTPETSPSGNIHGMPLAACLGYGPEALTHLLGFAPKVRPEDTALIGLRDLDEGERDIVRRSGVHAYSMRDVDERGVAEVTEEALERACEGTDGFHLSFDLDAVDPMWAPGVGTPVRGGLSYRESHLLLEIAAERSDMVGLEVAELNPIIDEHNKTGRLAVELILSALGKSIL